MSFLEEIFSSRLVEPSSGLSVFEDRDWQIEVLGIMFVSSRIAGLGPNGCIEVLEEVVFSNRLRLVSCSLYRMLWRRLYGFLECLLYLSWEVKVPCDEMYAVVSHNDCELKDGVLACPACSGDC